MSTTSKGKVARKNGTRTSRLDCLICLSQLTGLSSLDRSIDCLIGSQLSSHSFSYWLSLFFYDFRCATRPRIWRKKLYRYVLCRRKSPLGLGNFFWTIYFAWHVHSTQSNNRALHFADFLSITFLLMPLMVGLFKMMIGDGFTLDFRCFCSTFAVELVQVLRLPDPPSSPAATTSPGPRPVVGRRATAVSPWIWPNSRRSNDPNWRASSKRAVSVWFFFHRPLSRPFGKFPNCGITIGSIRSSTWKHSIFSL